jgi:hypothetical protein
MAPFVYAAGVGGFFYWLSERRATAWARISSATLTALTTVFLVLIVIRQDQRVLAQADTLRISPELISMVERIPGRVLFDFGVGNEVHPALRWAIYSIVPDIRGVSTADPPFKGLGTPFDFVLTRDRSPASLNSGLASAQALTLFRANERTFLVVDPAGDAQGFLHLSGKSAPQPARLLLYNFAGSQASIEGSVGAYTSRRENDPALKLKLDGFEPGEVLRLTWLPHQLRYVPDWEEVAAGSPAVVKDLKHLLDVLPRLSQGGVQSADGIILGRSSGGVTLEKERAGFARLLMSFELPPGEYFLRFKFGELFARRESKAGYGAYIASDNRPETAVDLDYAANSEFYYRFIVNDEKAVSYGIGFGAWGAAAGMMRIEALDLFRR